MNKIVSISMGVLAASLMACSSSKSSTKAASMNAGSNTSASAASSLNTLTGQEKNDGWKLLFDGTTTNGWHTYGKDKAGDAWKAQDGALVLQTGATQGYQTSGGGDLVTNQEFGNFDFKVDWKISKGGNSGIIFYVHEDSAKYKESWNTGMEMQVLDNGDKNNNYEGGHPDAKIYKHRAGDLYDLIESKEAVKPVGEWNQVEVVSNNGKLDFYMNGEHTLSTTMWDDNWKQLIAGSKFKDMPDFGTFKNGKIALQDHGHEVWFRNIKIKSL